MVLVIPVQPTVMILGRSMGPQLTMAGGVGANRAPPFQTTFFNQTTAFLRYSTHFLPLLRFLLFQLPALGFELLLDVVSAQDEGIPGEDHR